MDKFLIVFILLTIFVEFSITRAVFRTSKQAIKLKALDQQIFKKNFNQLTDNFFQPQLYFEFMDDKLKAAELLNYVMNHSQKFQALLRLGLQYSDINNDNKITITEMMKRCKQITKDTKYVSKCKKVNNYKGSIHKMDIDGDGGVTIIPKTSSDQSEGDVFAELMRLSLKPKIERLIRKLKIQHSFNYNLYFFEYLSFLFEQNQGYSKEKKILLRRALNLLFLNNQMFTHLAKAYFDVVDQNRDGKITHYELSQHFRELKKLKSEKINVNPQLITNIIKKYDKNQNGSIEFNKEINNKIVLKQMNSVIVNYLSKIFKSKHMIWPAKQ